jgi:hypothetical protein
MWMRIKTGGSDRSIPGFGAIVIAAARAVILKRLAYLLSRVQHRCENEIVCCRAGSSVCR